MKQEKCKHDGGWFRIKPTEIFIFNDGKVEFDSEGRNRTLNKVKLSCNNGCGARRNIYIKSEVIKYGKIHKEIKNE